MVSGLSKVKVSVFEDMFHDGFERFFEAPRARYPSGVGGGEYIKTPPHRKGKKRKSFIRVFLPILMELGRYGQGGRGAARFHTHRNLILSCAAAWKAAFPVSPPPALRTGMNMGITSVFFRQDYRIIMIYRI